MRTHAHDTLTTFTTHHDNDVVSITPRAHLVIFGREVDASEGNVNGALIAWQLDADARAVQGMSPSPYGQLWERVASATYMPAQTVEATPDMDTYMYVCTDCMLADVNRDFSGVDEDRAAELWSVPGTVGVYVGDEDRDLDFGTMPCAACDTHLAGARHLYDYDI